MQETILMKKEYYYRMRSEYNNIVSSEWFRNFVNRGLVIESDIDKRNAVRLSSLLLYLNKTAYNGLYRENKKGLFNVPFGRYKNPKIVDEERLYNASEILQRLNLYNTDFSYVLDVAKSGDIVYFDPPYLPVSRTANFTNYTSDGFSYNDHIRLRNVCIELHNRGVYFILSNSYTKKILELYKSVKDFEVFVVSANRFINSNAKKRKGAKEIIITNVPEEIRRGSII